MLSDASLTVFDFLPDEIRTQLLLDPSPSPSPSPSPLPLPQPQP